MEDVRDENDQNRHQHLKIVSITFCLQHPSPTSMWPEIFLSVLLVPGAHIRIITTKDPLAYQLVLFIPASVFADL